MTYGLDIEQLRTFLAIVELGSFTRAGEAVHKTQSAVSMQMRRLEDRVGKPVFKRNGRLSALTLEGERLVVYARRIIDLNDETLDALSAHGSNARIRLAIPDEFADRLMPSVVASYQRLHPMTDIHVLSCTCREAVAALDAGAADLALVSSTSNRPVGGRLLRREPLHWVGSIRSSVHRHGTVRLVAGGEACAWRRVAQEGLRRVGLEHVIAYQCACASGLLGAIASGLGISVFPASAVRDGLCILDDTGVLPPLPDSELSLLTSRKAPGIPALEHFCRHAAAALGNLPGNYSAAAAE